MRAWRTIAVGEPREVMQQTETELEPIGPGELRIRVAAAGLGFPDVLMCRGTYPLTPPLPFTSGQEFVGTVVETGHGVSVAVGTRLMGVSTFMIGRGSFAEECKTYEMMAFPAPSQIPDAEAASFTIAYHTGYIALSRRAKLAQGETLLVHGGAGGTGFAAIQLGKALGAKVIATASGADKAAFCRDLGADLAIDNSREDFVAAVNEATGGKGADVVYDPVGGELFEKSVNCMAIEGRLLPIGFACGRWGVVSPETLALKNIAIVGALGGGFERPYMLSMHDTLMELYAKGAIKPMIDRKIGFSEIGAGVQALADRKVRGRVVAVY